MSSTPEKEKDSNANRQNAQAPACGSAGQSGGGGQGAAGGIIAIAGGSLGTVQTIHTVGTVQLRPGSGGIIRPANFVFRESDVKTPPLPSEFKAGEIIAWRCWKYAVNEAPQCKGIKRSMHMDSLWRDDKMTGDVDYMQKGVYAWKTREQAETYGKDFLHAWSAGYGSSGYPRNNINLAPEILIGTVQLWGEVIEHENGYRGEFAKVKEIVHTIDHDDLSTQQQLLIQAQAQQHIASTHRYPPMAQLVVEGPQYKRARRRITIEAFFVTLGFIGMAIGTIMVLSLLIPK